MSKPVSDIDGRVLEHPPQGSEIAQNPRWIELAVLERLLMFCRRNNIAITGLARVGELIVQVQDLEVGSGSRAAPDPGGWAEMGGYHGRDAGG